VDQADDSKMTQLSWAALMHRPEMVRYLLSRGANPQHRDKFGLTPEKHVLGVHYAPEATMKALKERSVANARP
jgi:ankyrin repeat protein